MLVQHIGLVPMTFPRAPYDTTGKAVVFRFSESGTAHTSAHVSVYVYSGTALLALDGASAGPFIELASGQAFDFPLLRNICQLYYTVRILPLV